MTTNDIPQTPAVAQTQPTMTEPDPMPIVSPPVQTPSNRSPKKKMSGLWRSLFSLVLLVLLVWGLYEYVSQQDGFSLTQLLLREKLTDDTSTPLSQYVDRSKETQETVALLKRECTAKNDGAICKSFALNEESLVCEESAIAPCCGNLVCEEGEDLTCAKECETKIGQGTLGTPLALKFDSEQKLFILAAQTFTTTETESLLTAVKLPILFGVGSDRLVVLLFEMENPDLPNSGSLIWKTEVPVGEIRKETLSLPVPRNLKLLSGKTYGLVLGTKTRLGSVQVGISTMDTLPQGDLWIGRNEQALATDSAGIAWYKQKGDLGFELTLVKI